MVKHMLVPLREVLKSNYRLDATHYPPEVYKAYEKLEKLKEKDIDIVPLRKIVSSVFLRSRFARIWADEKYGVPYLSPSEALKFKYDPPFRRRYLNRRQAERLGLLVREGWLLLSCSGGEESIGIPIFVNRELSRYAFTHDIIRIVPCPDKPFASGYLYAYLSTDIGQSLVKKPIYGMQSRHIEPEHVSAIPVPLLPLDLMKKIHSAIERAWRLRELANTIERETILTLEKLLKGEISVAEAREKLEDLDRSTV